ncbi:hypothetical protein HPB48_002344 [Haemaphysalis longicornis]|uniref:Transposable element P transposase-like GTP-binding insertion domain-containing protein n=1 Tax=Haemaphysalis longicornis TaxID=44386 RepID=A0A9J6GPZ8_HAELO|nr:hypothetical protein HPB48_002344 [Haemaphysalis longicornis]
MTMMKPTRGRQYEMEEPPASVALPCSVVGLLISICSNPMKVKLAAQTFSSSVSKALVFASELRLPEFAGCSGTAQFIASY